MARHHYLVGMNFVGSAASTDQAKHDAERMQALDPANGPWCCIDADTPSKARDIYWRETREGARRHHLSLAGG